MTIEPQFVSFPHGLVGRAKRQLMVAVGRSCRIFSISFWYPAAVLVFRVRICGATVARNLRRESYYANARLFFGGLSIYDE
jgi:hypothetical protein